ncbi:MAG: PepSY-like domain-containing protein [Bacteroidota bacterium]|nr:PepSY-like domain-containing protein [Bacteroidota bacterium]
MKTKKNSRYINILLTLSFLTILASCKKENSVVNPTPVAASSIVAVGVNPTTNDSIYVIGTSARKNHLDTLAFSALPSTIADYLTTNYAGYTFTKSFSEQDTSGNIQGYVVIISYNGNPVGLKFDASGNFVKVLEQRDGHDMDGKGWREGGCFSNRDGMNKDTVQLSSLPPDILSYFNTNYPQDTLIRAFKTLNSDYAVFSIDNGSFATLFDSTGTFIRRVQLNENQGGARAVAVVTQSALPSTIQDYLTNTYPNYVFEQAFSISKNGSLSAYVVCIDANGTKYAVEFDASGNFVRSITFRFW